MHGIRYYVGIARPINPFPVIFTKYPSRVPDWFGGKIKEPLETQQSGPNLLVVLVSLVVDDVEELELVDTARGGDDAEPVTELLLLEELLGPRKVC